MGKPITTQSSRRTTGLLLRFSLLVAFAIILLIALFSDPTTVKHSLPTHITMFADTILSNFHLSDSDEGFVNPVSPLHKSDWMANGGDAKNAVIEGGPWAKTLHTALHPECPAVPVGAPPTSLTRMYDGPKLPRTAFASFPRSGNSYIRALVERATGFRTTSTYCDKALAQTFVGECDRGEGSYFFKKTHYPALKGRGDEKAEEKAFEFDRAVQVVRNPLDTLYSYWSFETLRLTHKATVENKHTTHLNVTLGETEQQRVEVLALADRWNLFHDVWATTPIPKLTLRYEDLRTSPLPSVMQLTAFLLPASQHPPLSSLACALTLDPHREAYKSNKSPVFDSWDKWDPSVRNEVLQRTRKWWCGFGYAQTLEEILEIDGGINCDEVTKEVLRLTREQSSK